MQRARDPALSPAASFGAWQARLQLGFERLDDGGGARTVLRRLGQFGPLTVQKPLYPEGPLRCHAIVLHPPGGIAGGDQLELGITVGEGAEALLTTPGAAKWYASVGPEARQRIQLSVAAGGCLEWLPQESIVFDGAQAQSEVEISLGKGARLAYWDIVCLGRPSNALPFTRGAWRQSLRIRGADGRVRFLERGRLQGGDALLSSPMGLAGLPVMGTLILAGQLDRDRLAAVRELPSPAGVQLGWTQLEDLIVLRALASQAEPLRAAFVQAWQALRPECLGRPAVLPRIWAT